jgi:hypothetical protein
MALTLAARENDKIYSAARSGAGALLGCYGFILFVFFHPIFIPYDLA